ncbi:MAG: GHKL domain-containing protein [Lachnospiraceae bacterium]|nr:GHKL domain-containing protein [Lachnospiraceae bacterium]
MMGIVVAMIECIIIVNFIIKSLEPKKPNRKWLLYAILTALLLVDLHIGKIIFKSESIIGIVQIIICLLFSLLFLKGSLYKKIFISVISNQLILIINVLLMTILSTLLETDILMLIKQQNTVWLYAVLLSKLCYFLVTCFLLSLQKKVSYQISLKEGGAILLIFIVTLFIGIAILEQNIIAGNYENHYINISIIGLIAINVLSFWALTFISKENDKKLKYYLLEVQLENQKNEIKEVQKQYNEIQKLRHDFKNYILCSLTLLKEDKISEAKKYLADIVDEKLTPERAFIYTTSSTLNAIINAKLNKCRQCGIEIHYQVVEQIEIDDIDLSILFANLFDNAIEACAHNTSKSSIHLTVTYEKAYLNIIMKNTIEKPVLKHNPKLVTTKKDKKKHGYGLKTIDDIVQKYDGIKKYYEKDNYFYADLWLKLPFVPEKGISCQTH